MQPAGDDPAPALTRAVWLGLLLACGGGPAKSVDSGPVAVPTGSSPSTPTGDPGTAVEGTLFLTEVPASWRDGDTYRFTSGWEVFDVTAALYAENGDDYDMVVIFTDFEVADLWQFALTTRADIAGIGQQEVYGIYGWPLDMTADAGSAGRLEHVVFMNHRFLWDRSRYTALEILTHEVGHRWSANALLPSQPDPGVLLDASLSHWANVANVGGPSALGYGDLEETAPGTFTHRVVQPLAYAPLELYQMGLLAPDDLPDLWYVADPVVDGVPLDPDRYGEDLTFTGTRVPLSAADLIADLGPRVPSWTEAPTTWNVAFAVVCRPDGCDGETVDWVEEQRVAWPATFEAATGGRATMSAEL